MLRTSRTFERVAGSALLLALLAAGPAGAQPAPTQPTGASTTTQPADEARRLFEAGVAAMQHEDWPAALDSFERSSALRRSAAVALNQAVVLRAMHRYIEARVRLNEFNELASPQQHQQHDADVVRMSSEMSRLLGRVRIPEVIPVSATVAIDGRPARLNEAGEAVVDPGDHSLHAEAPGYESLDRTFRVGESELHEERIRLAVVPPPTATVTPHPAETTPATPVDPRVAPTPAPAASRPLYARWWLWAGIGAVALAGVVTGVVIGRSGTNALPSTTTNARLQAATFGGTQ